MNVVVAVFILLGAGIACIAGLGILRFSSSFARFHAAGKASPIAFLAAAIGAGLELGSAGSALLLIGAAAMTLTLPFGVHLLFRAVHLTGTHIAEDHAGGAEPDGLAAGDDTTAG